MYFSTPIPNTNPDVIESHSAWWLLAGSLALLKLSQLINLCAGPSHRFIVDSQAHHIQPSKQYSCDWQSLLPNPTQYSSDYPASHSILSLLIRMSDRISLVWRHKLPCHHVVNWRGGFSGSSTSLIIIIATTTSLLLVHVPLMPLSLCNASARTTTPKNETPLNNHGDQTMRPE